MRIRVGYELIYECPQPTPMLLMLNVHHSRVGDIVVPDQLTTDPPLAVHAYRDGFGNWCSRILAPPGTVRIASTAVVNDSGTPDPVVASASQHAVQDLPEDDSGIPARQPLLRDRSAVRHRVAAVRRDAARLAAGAGDLRFRAQPHHVWLRACPRDENSAARPSTSVAASAATSRISRSRCVAA